MPRECNEKRWDTVESYFRFLAEATVETWRFDVTGLVDLVKPFSSNEDFSHAIISRAMSILLGTGGRAARDARKQSAFTINITPTPSHTHCLTGQGIRVARAAFSLLDI
jgi:hypothetical protein